ncbi:MAG TPA: glycosyltransferase [Planctomycetota bacterium]|nr:glycosyltransferase [Planctomycetota bacterium]
MRILHAMECTIGGTRRHLVDVVRGQLERGHPVALAVACLREPRFRADLEDLQRRGARVFEIPMLRSISPWRDAKHLGEVRRALRAFEPDVVHTHSSKAGVLGRLASLLEHRGARIHTPHAFAFLFSAEFSAAKRGLFRRMETSLARRTARIIAVSEGEAATIRASGVVPPERLRVVRNGIDPAPWLAAKPADRASLGIPEDVPLILVAGQLHIGKGQDLAVEALARPGLERAHLLLLGGGPLQARIEQLASELKVRDRLHLPGWSDQVGPWMLASDLVLLPSRWEAMPYIVLEAMACAKAVVATRVDGAREMIVEGENGALCEIESAESIAQALQRILAQVPAQRSAMGLRGREKLLAEGTASRMVDRLLAVYAEAR